MDAKYCLEKAAEISKEKKEVLLKILDFSKKLDEVMKNPGEYKDAYNSFYTFLHHSQYENLATVIEMYCKWVELGIIKPDKNKIITEKNQKMFEEIQKIERALHFWRYIAPDSIPKLFDGDIIITDPCYLRKNDNSDCFSWAEENGICRDTIYGDWSCTTYNTRTNKELGKFCADSGNVCVVTLEDALKFNPDFNYHIEKPWTTTLIKDFHGYIYSSVKEEKYGYEGKEYVDYSLHIIGIGNVSFKTSQTGF